ncbi:MAG: alpha/beta fold hydrolase [Elusimicrobia bacterium]|nr:alpha/beta fold hydrolase [Elusimicrobiota bacterium]
MIKKTIYLAVIFAAGPCFAASNSLEQLENSSGALMPAAQVDIPSIDLEPADTAGYAQALDEFAAYRESKLNGIKNEDNLPFLLAHGAKTRNTVVMIHGLTDSPWFMRKLGEILYEQGYNVVSLLLPGHGTKPEDLLTATKQQWQQEVDRGLGIAAGLGERISLAGFSTGGALSLDALRRHPELKADKLFLFSPALAINERNQQSVSLGCPASTTRIIGPYTVPADTVEDNPYYYNKMAVNGVCQLYNLTLDNQNGRAKILESLRFSGTAVFTVESEADIVVSSAAVTDFMASLPDPSRSVYIRYPLSEGIAHGAVTRPETNPRFPELSRKLLEFVSKN